MDAHSGTTLEIVNTTVAYGARTVSAVTEVCVRLYNSVRVLTVCVSLVDLGRDER